MPNKKGSRVAASRARAQARAKKKAHSGGPVLPAAAYAVPAPETEKAEAPQEQPTPPEPIEALPQAQSHLVGLDAADAAHQPASSTPVRRASQRRERQTVLSVPGSSLRREVGLIGAITAGVAVILAVLKLATDLGT